MGIFVGATWQAARKGKKAREGETSMAGQGNIEGKNRVARDELMMN
jgi:hypothetical protein